MFFKKNKVGLDFGATSLKLCVLKKKGKKALLEDLLILPISHGAIEAGEVINPDIVAACLQQGLQKKSYAKSEAIVGMFGNSVIIKKISMPKMDTKILKEQLNWEAEQYIPFSIDEAVLDFHILGQAVDTMDVLLVAAKQDSLFRYFESVESAGLKCSVVDINSLALVNCFEWNYGLKPGVVALVNVGASVSNVVILEDGQVSFTRDIPYGGMLYDTEIARELNIEVNEAEGLKLGASFQQETPDEVHTAIQYVNDTVSQEINNSFDFFHSTGGDKRVSEIYVTGGASQTPGLVEKVQEIAQIPCVMMDPFQNIEVSKKIDSEYLEQVRLFLPVVLGLGLRNIES